MIIVENKRTYQGKGDYIGRPTVLGNPVKIGERCQFCGEVHREGGSTLKCYKQYLWKQMNQNSAVKKAVRDLAVRHRNGEDIILICWCKPNPCHGDVLAKAIEWMAATMP